MIEPAIVARARTHGGRTAVISENRSYTYSDLIRDSEEIAWKLLGSDSDLQEARVGFLFPPSYDYVRVQWGIWRAGGIAVPLCTSHPAPELEYALSDSGTSIVVAHKGYADLLRPLAEKLNLRWVDLDPALPNSDFALPAIPASRRAMILYTSGTTGKPKGVVTTHANNQAQIENLIQAWGWTQDDRILEVLPLHHLHGIVNVVGCSLWAGAVCDMMPKFDAVTVWQRFEQTELTLFMAVPTIYAKLAAAWDEAEKITRRRWSGACKKMRLMVSGSAALPAQMLERWQSISGHRLLERYGMTEVGIALSNPLHGKRVAGHVGSPVPNVEVRLRTDDGRDAKDGEPGEIHVSGPGVFAEYWQRPKATEESFDGKWFKTGDIAARTNGIYRILGRSSVDIIKTGGEKVSALEIEETMLEHSEISECAVVGIPDEEWGEVVGAAIVPKNGGVLDAASLREWCKSRLASSKTPRRILFSDELPRNAMGKVTKPEVVRLFRMESSAP